MHPVTDPYQVFLLSPNDIFADALQRMLADGDIAEVVFCATDDQHCLDALNRQAADILLINAKSLSYPLSAFFQRYHDVRPGMQILVFGHEDHEAFVRNLVRSGCRGFINEQSVKVYLHRLFLKFRVSNRSQLIVAALERVCPVDHLVELLRETLDHSRTWQYPGVRKSARSQIDHANSLPGG